MFSCCIRADGIDKQRRHLNRIAMQYQAAFPSSDEPLGDELVFANSCLVLLVPIANRAREAMGNIYLQDFKICLT